MTVSSAPPAGAPAFESVVLFFKTLADASRLRLLGLLANGERSVDELATLLQLRPPTVSHHLARLRELGLVAMRAEGNVHLYRLDQDALRVLSRDVLSVKRVASFADAVEMQGWEQKVLRDFFDGPRLKEIPASRKKRDVVLKQLAMAFQPQVRYSETEVNDVLRQYHPDPATLRRELVGAGLLERSRSVYWRANGGMVS